MGKVILVTGGARSGKSGFSEKLLSGRDAVLYIATATPLDEEMERRIAHHRAQRPEAWETLEAFSDLERKLNEKNRVYDGILLDCITVMLTNQLFHHPDFQEDQYSEQFWSDFEKKAKLGLHKFLAVARSMSYTVILVTNEIGMGLVPETALSRQFRDLAGRINQMLAAEADEVYLLVAGIPLKIKEGNPS
ncbi:bifunctional adenosylcobinamide kinase/adenosylcobinamide-phosphate guanylyltransferase [Proteiniclasticum sp. SCR006]|uniref:Adenosylcobinamide kinase n=1 Tax=Proteiniclasticum aestuarii TaxID=2817862 RepID=A0A939KJA5_9CLOT|nr:bifunctional adenosylcobinamide kinase/adenosylcobinamide-phosphate guanylyltransferase [Proteiniclasticum aestuarii]MBO1263490.1 bifunctional adenosylcobinamide kinase/adenosylcobinamide-phosphate guanylyltransferase [Proteiniclasticum aestuarii]